MFCLLRQLKKKVRQTKSSLNLKTHLAKRVCSTQTMTKQNKQNFTRIKKKLRGNLQKKPSIFKDIVQIEVDPPASHPIFDKFIFDTVLIMLTSLPPLKFLTKITKF